MEENLLKVIKGNKLFASVDENELSLLLPRFEKFELGHGEVLFQPGDPSYYVYLLASGRLSTYLTTTQGTTELIGHIEPGEPVGETGALTGEPRSLMVKAVKDSVLLRITASQFLELCNRYPGVLFASIHPIVMRSRNLIETLSAEKKIKHIVVVPANRETSLNEFCQLLMKLTDKYSSIAAITDDDPIFQGVTDETSLQNKIKQLTEQKRTSRRTIYVLKDYNSPLAQHMIKKADAFYVVAFSLAKTIIDPAILEIINTRRVQHKSEPTLILLHTDRTMTPRKTANWLMLAQFNFHHHLRLDVPKDYHRLLRFMRGKPVGIVLGGGGTRGWAHLGVLKAIREKKIPIDMIGGTSVGAIIAGCYAVHESIEDAHERFYKIVQAANGSVTWRSLTWPAISIFNAKTFTHSLMDVFNDIQIEDLWLPFFSVSSNLATNTEDTQRTGSLWQATRASAALPGILPPILFNGELHYDGGLLNNLPVDIMREILGKRARIIAAEIGSFSTDKHKYSFPPIVKFWDVILNYFGLSGEKYRFPRFVDTFMRGMFIGSLAKAKQNGLAANILVSLNLNKYRLLHTNFKQVDRIIDIGYQAALEQIETFREKHT